MPKPPNYIRKRRLQVSSLTSHVHRLWRKSNGRRNSKPGTRQLTTAAWFQTERARVQESCLLLRRALWPRNRSVKIQRRHYPRNPSPTADVLQLPKAEEPWTRLAPPPNPSRGNVLLLRSVGGARMHPLPSRNPPSPAEADTTRTRTRTMTGLSTMTRMRVQADTVLVNGMQYPCDICHQFPVLIMQQVPLRRIRLRV